MMVKKGDYIKLLNRDGQYSKWAKKPWIVTHIARNRNEHPGYDEGIGGNLIDCKGLPCSVYDWEFRVMKKKRK